MREKFIITNIGGPKGDYATMIQGERLPDGTTIITSMQSKKVSNRYIPTSRSRAKEGREDAQQ